MTDKEYEHALHIWNKFEMKHYHGLYLKCNILLQADMFGKFRNNSFRVYVFCPGNYLSSPGLSWMQWLK